MRRETLELDPVDAEDVEPAELEFAMLPALLPLEELLAIEDSLLADEPLELLSALDDDALPALLPLEELLAIEDSLLADEPLPLSHRLAEKDPPELLSLIQPPIAGIIHPPERRSFHRLDDTAPPPLPCQAIFLKLRNPFSSRKAHANNSVTASPLTSSRGWLRWL